MKNLGNAPLRVPHSELLRCGDSLYKSKCPACPDGILLMYRDETSFDLLAEDRCSSCAQAIIYTDIEKVRECSYGGAEEDDMATCPNCGKNYLPVLAKDKAGVEKWKSGMKIQDVWPAASEIEREQLQTGICSDECWDRFLGGKDER